MEFDYHCMNGLGHKTSWQALVIYKCKVTSQIYLYLKNEEKNNIHVRYKTVDSEYDQIWRSVDNTST